MHFAEKRRENILTYYLSAFIQLQKRSFSCLYLTNNKILLPFLGIEPIIHTLPHTIKKPLKDLLEIIKKNKFHAGNGSNDTNMSSNIFSNGFNHTKKNAIY